MVMLTLKKILNRHSSAIYLIVVFIIAVSTLIPIFSHSYFTMHDDQHVARLYLLDQAINQGTLYPRWVDQLGFGYGYPLFNFYPPLIYYVAELFRSVGFGYILSIKLMLVVGSIVGSLGVYLFTKKIYGSLSGLVASMLFTFLSYRAITIYVRGAFAEYWALSLVPWMLLALFNLYRSPTHKNTLLAGCSFALIVLAHPFIAIPSSFLVVMFVSLLYMLTKKEHRSIFLRATLLSGVIALALSAIFWLPSMIERKYTLVDTILLRELASYAIHFVYPQQLWFSPWGFGGSVQGLGDGISFQINKPYLAILLGTVAGWFWYISKVKDRSITKITSITIFTASMMGISLFLMLPYSAFIWERIAYLQYLQFPWRFMAFFGLFAAIFSGSVIFLIGVIPGLSENIRWRIQFFITGMIFLLIFGVQTKYFKPQQYINSTDVERTSYHEIAWRISKSSFEFVPKGVRTKKTIYNTTTLDIEEKEVAERTHTIIAGTATVDVASKRFDYKRFTSDASTPYFLQMHTFNFPGWKAYIDGVETTIDDTNDFKLIRVNVPKGKHIVEIRYHSTMVQKIATGISIIAWVYFFSVMYLSLSKPHGIRQKSED